MRAVHLVPAAAVLVALGAIGGVAQLGHPATAQRPATLGPASSPAATRQVPVTSAARACPPAPGGGAAPVALLAGGASATGQGQVELTALPPAGLPVRVTGPVRAHSSGALSLLTLPAVPAATRAKAKNGTPAVQGWSVAGGGTMAQGMEAELTRGSGLASV